MLVMGIVGAGGVFAGTNPSYTSMELTHHIKTAKAKFLISEPEILQPLLAAAKETNIPQQNIWIFDVFGQALPPGMRSWKELLRYGEHDWVQFDHLKTAKLTTAARLYSSGTTGLPKATIITHYNLVAQQELVCEVHPKPYNVSCEEIFQLPQFYFRGLKWTCPIFV
jgi:acyl-CoA synthetase (AMP-forming)/AMP-acid ligase II